ncbi:Beta-agarase AgaB34 [Tetrabaena socialis]|uniref:Beta-agarase AgaB34 n=1 Tax=Tetrabaena socialis TaxID=47790 RepID=A0A2J8A751_9CHLO|nr:Beta-agarase AgaB34 [Tetrabaena socialis]|eukprot:PNH08325.1 Beta-agarase AgaB34 [Tetrabaena socialis]
MATVVPVTGDGRQDAPVIRSYSIRPRQASAVEGTAGGSASAEPLPQLAAPASAAGAVAAPAAMNLTDLTEAAEGGADGEVASKGAAVPAAAGRTSGGSAYSAPRSAKAGEIAALLRDLDRNKDGRLDVNEVSDLLERMVKEEHQSALLKRLVIILAVAMLVLLGCLAGMAAAIVYFSKDTVLRGDLLVNKYTGQPVLVQSADFVVSASGAMVSRSSATAGDILAASSGSTAGAAASPSGGCGAAPAPSGRRRTLTEELMYPDERDHPHYAANLAAANAAADSAEPATDAAPGASRARALHRSLLQQLGLANSTAGGGTNCAAGSGNATTKDAAGNVTGIMTKLTGGAATEPVPLSTAASAVPLGLHSALPMAVLKELKYLQINSTSGAQLSLFVLAVAKMPAPFEEGSYTSCEVVKIVTYVGTITIHGSVLEFGQDAVSDIFRDAGFLVTGTGRRRMLGGAYDLIGFFNFIKDLEIANLPPNEPKPHLAPIFEMKARIYDECLEPFNKSRDRCVGLDGRDRPGTVVEGGVRFMTYYQTAVRQHDLVLTTYEFVGTAASLVRKELVNETSGDVYKWQDLLQGTRFTHCEYGAHTGTDLDSFQSLTKDQVVSFVFVGYEMKLGVATRHFRLTTRQAVLRNDDATAGNITDGMPYDVQLVDVDFWDTSDNGDVCSIQRNNYPVAFEMVHPLAGVSKVHVVSFKANITQPDSVFALPTRFNDTDDAEGCPNTRFTNVPRVSDPFDPAWAAPPKDKLAALFTTSTRVTATLDDPDALQTLMVAFPFLNGSFQDGSARRRAAELQAWSPQPGEQLVPLVDFPLDLADFFFNFGDNGTELELTKEGRALLNHVNRKSVGPCSYTITTDETHVRVRTLYATCNARLPAFPLIVVYGTLNVVIYYSPRLTGYFDGCLGAKIDLKGLLKQNRVSWLVSWLFPDAIDILKICLAYDSAKQLGSLTASLYLPNLKMAWAIWAARFETDFQDCLKLERASVKVQYKSGLFFPSIKTACDLTLVQAGSGVSGTVVARLRNVNSKCIDVPYANQYNGNGLQLHDCGTDPNSQKVMIQPVGDAYSIKFTSGKGFDVSGWGFSNGARVQVWDHYGMPNQLWTFQDTGGGYYLIKSKLSGKCVDISGGSTANGAVIQQWDCGTTNNNQRWKLETW